MLKDINGIVQFTYNSDSLELLSITSLLRRNRLNEM